MSLYNADGQINTTQVVGNAYTGLHASDGSINVVINASSSYVGLYHTCGAFNAFVTTNPSAGFYAANGSMNVIAAGSGYVSVVPAGNGSHTASGTTAPVLSLNSEITGLITLLWDIDNTIVAGDTLTRQVASDIGFTTIIDTVAHIITAGEDTANQITASQYQAPSNSTYYIRGYVTSVTLGISPASNILTVVVTDMPTSNIRISSTGNSRISSAGNFRKAS